MGIVEPAEWYYILIRPDGSFASEYHLMTSSRPHGLGNHVDYLSGNYKDGEGCKIIDSKPLFKAIRR
ncbi:hypothetical protein CBGD1_856 [Sulfurimonas gotlandica GD1]|nr:hypothetical protein CBGD1_856 [Sulfurimonas gotlandica GD1]